ncbi:Aspartokinase [Gimesia panareensis]|uniref:aspartate kinase n=1 Tax=Gimesia panareensis TaxID=2527978 RepID=A0A518FK00_9PLAN|nr:aspartate kinase [Gimesia panareensis]QDV16669.1 Aspartokinase [Gimesia panareensis]
MSLIVQKFGGTSVADTSKIQAAARRATAMHQAGHQVVMVVSARGKKTDELVGLAAEITDHPTPREMDMLLSTGEQESVALMAMAIHKLGVEAISLTGSQIGVVTDSSHTKARIISISTERMKTALNEGKIVIAAGFQGRDKDWNITTLGRGGSDTTATALAAVLEADMCEIYTDVEGVFTTDPRVVPEAHQMDSISYDEMLELASLGAGVMHSRSIEFAKKYKVPLKVRPSFSDGEGTLIAAQPLEGAPVVTGVAFVRDEVRVSLTDIPDEPGIMSSIFARMAERKICLDMIVQDVGTGGLARVSFTVPQSDLAETLTAADEAIQAIGAGKIQHGTNLSKVSIVGSGMRNHYGVASRMFSILAEANINVGMITTSEIKVTVLVDRNQCDEAVRVIHNGFELDRLPSYAFASNAASAMGGQAGESHPEMTDLEQEIVDQLSHMEDIVVSEVLFDQSQSRVTVRNLPDNPGICSRLFSVVAEGGVSVDMIVQNMGEDEQAHLSFTVPRTSLEKSLKLVQPLLSEWGDAELSHEAEIAKLSVVGIGLRSHTGVGQSMFSALAEAGINIQMINTSETRISAVVALSEGEKAYQGLLEKFSLG